MSNLSDATAKLRAAQREVEQEEATARYRRGYDLYTHWRVGHKVGRTIYAVTRDKYFRPLPREEHPLIGMMDTPELAREAVRAHNRSIDIRSAQ